MVPMKSLSFHSVIVSGVQKPPAGFAEQQLTAFENDQCLRRKLHITGGADFVVDLREGTSTVGTNKAAVNDQYVARKDLLFDGDLPFEVGNARLETGLLLGHVIGDAGFPTQAGRGALVSWRNAVCVNRQRLANCSPLPI